MPWDFLHVSTLAGGLIGIPWYWLYQAVFGYRSTACCSYGLTRMMCPIWCNVRVSQEWVSQNGTLVNGSKDKAGSLMV